MYAEELAKKYRRWTKESMAGTIASVTSSKMEINPRAANQYGVQLPWTLSGSVLQGANPGPTPYLSTEEAELI